MTVNRNSSNEELLNNEAVRAAVEAGNVILIDKVPTSNPEYTNLYFAGMVETQSASTVSAAQSMLLGWSETNQYMMRAQQNSKTDVAEKFPLGTVFQDFALQIVDSNTPAYSEQKPRQSKDGQLYLDEAGNKIYRSARLVTKAELEDEGHKTIRRAAVAKAPQASASVAALMSEAGATF
jgi:hypothetical protein